MLIFSLEKRRFYFGVLAFTTLAPFGFSQMAASPAAQSPVQTAFAQAATPTPDSPAALKSEIAAIKAKVTNFAQLDRYRDSNATLPSPASGEKRVVMFGDSITDDWLNYPETYFASKSYVDRGIRGQNTSQMLLRFRQDVIDLKPSVVVILAGANDISFRNGKAGVLEITERNLASMADLARVNGIKVVLATLLPVCNDQAAKRSPDDILALNRWITSFAKEQQITLLDYYPAMLDPATGQLRVSITHDCLHPNADGYRIMGPMVERAVASAIHTK